MGPKENRGKQEEADFVIGNGETIRVEWIGTIKWCYTLVLFGIYRNCFCSFCEKLVDFFFFQI